MLVVKAIFSTAIILFSVWLSTKKPIMAGFIIALPLTTLLVLPFAHQGLEDHAKSIAFAKSIFAAVPLSLLFFVPFLLAERFNLNFWWCYSLGIVLLVIGYFAHQIITGWLIR